MTKSSKRIEGFEKNLKKLNISKRNSLKELNN